MLEADQKAGIYQMRFGGLFDCKKANVHGVGLLIYDGVVENEVWTSPSNVSTFSRAS